MIALCRECRRACWESTQIIKIGGKEDVSTTWTHFSEPFFKHDAVASIVDWGERRYTIVEMAKAQCDQEFSTLETIVQWIEDLCPDNVIDAIMAVERKLKDLEYVVRDLESIRWTKIPNRKEKRAAMQRRFVEQPSRSRTRRFKHRLRRKKGKLL